MTKLATPRADQLRAMREAKFEKMTKAAAPKREPKSKKPKP